MQAHSITIAISCDIHSHQFMEDFRWFAKPVPASKHSLLVLDHQDLFRGDQDPLHILHQVHPHQGLLRTSRWNTFVTRDPSFLRRFGPWPYWDINDIIISNQGVSCDKYYTCSLRINKGGSWRKCCNWHWNGSFQLQNAENSKENRQDWIQQKALRVPWIVWICDHNKCLLDFSLGHSRCRQGHGAAGQPAKEGHVDVWWGGSMTNILKYIKIYEGLRIMKVC